MNTKGALLLTGALMLSGCLSGGGASAGTAEEGYAVDNCGHTFEFTSPPERIVLQDVSAVKTLAALGVLEKVVAKAGYFPEEYFDDETNAVLGGIKTLSDRLGESGHLEITKEAVIAENPDLVVGVSNAVNPETVSAVPVINEPGFCGEARNASFEHVYKEIDLHAAIFQQQGRAEAFKDELRARVAAIDDRVGRGRSVAVLYPAVKGSTIYAYGADSMSNPIVEAVGLMNVFSDVKERVMEISAEQLVAADPDVILLLHSGEDDLEAHVTSLPGAAGIAAVRERAIIPMLLAHAEPPTPMAVDGAELLEEALR